MIATAPDLCPALFSEWLSTFDGHTCAGYPQSDTDCPIARFLRASRWPQAVVGYTVWWPAGLAAGNAQRLPEWAYEFMEQACQAASGTRTGGVSVARARRILAACVEESA